MSYMGGWIWAAQLIQFGCSSHDLYAVMRTLQWCEPTSPRTRGFTDAVAAAWGE